MRWRRLKGESGSLALARARSDPDTGHNSEGWTDWPWERRWHYLRIADCRRVPNPRHPRCERLFTLTGRALCGRTFNLVGMLWRSPRGKPCPDCLAVVTKGAPAWEAARRSTWTPRSEARRPATEAEHEAMMRALPDAIRPDRYK